jgi:DNA-directed RNA polymerase subunit RPC12/RpoP
MQLVAIRTYDNYVNANLELGVLKQAGINCHLQDEHTITIDPLLSPAIGGIKLMTQKEDALTAIKLLNENDQHYLETLPCPACNHKTIQKVTIRKTFTTLGGKLLSILLNGQTVEERKIYKCYHCGKCFNQQPPPTFESI